MKRCKIVHIHDGNREVVHNGERLFVETHPRADAIVEEYLNQGYELKHMIPDFDPAINETGNFTFYKSGFIAYFEKVVEE